MKFSSFVLLLTICSLSLWIQEGIAECECECTCPICPTFDNDVHAYPPSTHWAPSPVNPPSNSPVHSPRVHSPSAPAPSPVVHNSPPSNTVKSPPPSSPPQRPTPRAPHQKPGHGILPLPRGPKSCWDSSSSSTTCQPQIDAFLHRNNPISVYCCTTITDMGEDCTGPYPHDYRRVREHCIRVVSLARN